jgi:hypothetical protein
MSVVNAASELANAGASAAPAPRERFERVWQLIETRLAALAEHANPILVKETRQALKSRQFVVTFLVVLAACWIVSFAGVAIIGPQIYYAAAGPEMLMAYYAILVFPLAVIVPYTAFRSLAAEQEENTYDLLSITTLTSKQIISGKLWSAVVQMLVFLSAVSPCIAFTFLLRGLDVLTLALLLAVAVFGCLGLSMIALFVGAASRVKHTQIVTSVALVLALFGAFASAVAIGVWAIEEGIPRQSEFWVFLLVLTTIYITSFGLLHAAAASQISFASENRSTPIRRWMMAQQACFIGGIAGMTYAFSGGLGQMTEVAAGVFMAAAGYWYVMGALMTAEWPHLSRRVQRSLPQSTIGRAFLSFFNPGPGAGYMFAVSNLTAAGLAALVLALYSAGGPNMSSMSFFDAAYVIVFGWSYVVGYLGLGRLVIGFLRRWMYVSLTAGFLFHVILVLAGVGIPLTIQMTSRFLRNNDYTLLQMSNAFWTLAELADHGPSSVQAPILLMIIPPLAIAVLLLNMRGVAAELRRHRVAAPQRVLEEEAALHPAPTPGPSNPWEVEDAEAGLRRLDPETPAG